MIRYIGSHSVCLESRDDLREISKLIEVPPEYFGNLEYPVLGTIYTGGMCLVLELIDD